MKDAGGGVPEGDRAGMMKVFLRHDALMRDAHTMLLAEKWRLIQDEAAHAKATGDFTNYSVAIDRLNALRASLVRMHEEAETPRKSEPPRAGQILLCLVIPRARHEDVLGDFVQKYQTIWLPRFGRSIANLIYVAQVGRACLTMLRYAMIAAVVEKVVGVVRHF